MTGQIQDVVWSLASMLERGAEEIKQWLLTMTCHLFLTRYVQYQNPIKVGGSPAPVPSNGIGYFEPFVTTHISNNSFDITYRYLL